MREKTNDPIRLFTPGGRPRGCIESRSLAELWIHTGTNCNLSCPFCLEGSKPGDKRIQAITLEDAKAFIDEALELGVEKFSFTGGAPMEQRLIIFTRYPEPGKTKTRLIPALGAEGAAALQNDMTRRILGVARRLSAEISLALEIRFEGGDRERMEARFGGGCLYRPQGAGRLGRRMQRAFVQASSEGAERVVVIGADCPEITAELLEEAFEQLSTKDLVLGPARDGGYYLIGLRQPAAQLFAGVSWGGDQVLEQTLRRAERLRLAVGLLKTLSDVDRPEDLAVWRRVKRSSGSAAAGRRISIIIPTLNEAAYLPWTLVSLEDAQGAEIIVVDGGSRDGTPEIAESTGCRVLRSPPRRALQLNTGAEAARGDLLLFLHADTRLPADFDSAVRLTLGESGVVAGAFRLRIDAPGWPFRLIERAVDIRSRLFQMPYGDQGVFVSAKAFRQVGGFPPLPIMDDFEFVRRLRRHGRIRTVRPPATTSGRRWRELGWWRTTWINQKVILGYCLGVSPERLAAWYRGDPENALDRRSRANVRRDRETLEARAKESLPPDSARPCNE